MGKRIDAKRNRLLVVLGLALVPACRPAASPSSAEAPPPPESTGAAAMQPAPAPATAPSAAPGLRKATPGKKPNVVVIMGDDVGGYNVGAYNQGIMAGRTPNLD